MGYPETNHLIENYKLSFRVIQMQTEGLSHEDSLLQLPFRGNCLNWVLGHIIDGRNKALALLEKDSLWDEEISRIYQRASAPISESQHARHLDLLLQDLNQSQSSILTALHEKTDDQLHTQTKSGENETTIGEQIAFLHWHETYHTGQLEILRQLSGKDDVVIP